MSQMHMDLAAVHDGLAVHAKVAQGYTWAPPRHVAMLCDATVSCLWRQTKFETVRRASGIGWLKLSI